MAGLRNGEWCYLNLFRKIIGGREVAVAAYENAAGERVRNCSVKDLWHSPGHGSFTAEAGDQIFAAPVSRGAFADVGKIRVLRRQLSRGSTRTQAARPTFCKDVPGELLRLLQTAILVIAKYRICQHAS